MLTLTQRLERFRDLGWTYDKETGIILSHKGTPVKHKICSIQAKSHGEVRVDIAKGRLAYYLTTGELPGTMYYKDGDANNVKWDNIINETDRIGCGGRPKKDRTYDTEYKFPPIKKEYVRKEHTSHIELTYQLIISLGLGKRTKRLDDMFITMTKNLSNKFHYYNFDDRKDCESEALLGILIGWKSFNPDKYSNAFPFVTEVLKRGFAKSLNKLKGKNMNSGITPSNVSINNFRQ